MEGLYAVGMASNQLLYRENCTPLKVPANAMIYYAGPQLCEPWEPWCLQHPAISQRWLQQWKVGSLGRRPFRCMLDWLPACAHALCILTVCLYSLFCSAREAIEYVMRTPLSTESAQPYRAEVGECMEPGRVSSAVQLYSMGKVQSVQDELALLRVLNQQPVIMFTNANDPKFRAYKGGIYDTPSSACQGSPNHAMLVVVSVCALSTCAAACRCLLQMPELQHIICNACLCASRATTCPEIPPT